MSTQLKQRTIYIQFGQQVVRKTSFQPNSNIIVRANQLGLKVKSMTEHTVTLQATTSSAYYGASKF